MNLKKPCSHTKLQNYLKKQLKPNPLLKHFFQPDVDENLITHCHVNTWPNLIRRSATYGQSRRTVNKFMLTWLKSVTYQDCDFSRVHRENRSRDGARARHHLTARDVGWRVQQQAGIVQLCRGRVVQTDAKVHVYDVTGKDKRKLPYHHIIPHTIAYYHILSHITTYYHRRSGGRKSGADQGFYFFLCID